MIMKELKLFIILTMEELQLLIIAFLLNAYYVVYSLCCGVVNPSKSNYYLAFHT